MANIRSAKKRIRSDARKTIRNRAKKSDLNTSIRNAREALLGNDFELAQEEVMSAVSKLDRAAEKGVIHRNNAARRKSRLMRNLAKISKSE
ncbi:MAG: 30S ribosomal protein S20 [Chloroflexi bacterium]|nr:30S ribosomal protein S20 [Chloroflexota bacterium]HCU81084.1 30S ribosomal protein S20 [Chloroflexota bacterium]